MNVRSTIWSFLPAIFVCVLLLNTPPALADITVASNLEARLLIDNSGSMYPGYAPPGRSGPTLAQSGGLFYAEYPETATWLNHFVAAQTILEGRSVSLATFTSSGPFQADDVQFLHRTSPLDAFDFAKLRSKVPPQGKHTYLTESLQVATRDFEGILWLITDNIVEDRRGVPDQGVQRFFQAMAGGERYRAVHLFKLPFSRIVEGKPGHLAVYGILVSDSDIEVGTLRYFDNKFRGAFLDARQQGSGRPLFPDEAYWKLKNLSIGVLELEIPSLNVEIVQQDRKLFRESQEVRLSLFGSVSSRLTQHRITGGRIELRPTGPFQPSGLQGEDYGLKTVPGSHFESTRSPLPPIPPRESARTEGQLVSNRPIPLETQGWAAWFKSATSGLKVTYRGEAEAYFTELVAEFDRTQMDGLFGADAAPEIFGIEPQLRIKAEVSNTVPISFELTSGYGRQLLVVLLVVLVLAFITTAYFFLFKTEKYRVRIAGQEDIVPIRRMGSRSLVHQGHALGRLVRDLFGGAAFEPNRHSAALQVKASATKGRFDVTVRAQGSEQLEIHHIGGGPVGLRSDSRTGSRPTGRGAASPSGGRIRPPGSQRLQSPARAAPPTSPSGTPQNSEQPSPGGAAAPQGSSAAPSAPAHSRITRPSRSGNPRIRRP